MSKEQFPWWLFYLVKFSLERHIDHYKWTGYGSHLHWLYKKLLVIDNLISIFVRRISRKVQLLRRVGPVTLNQRSPGLILAEFSMWFSPEPNQADLGK